MAKEKYGWQHQRERAKWAPIVAAGGVACHAAVCLMPSRRIHPDSKWDLGHTPDGTAWTGPEHARCNRSEGALRGNDARRGLPRGTKVALVVRRWVL
jgi:hypothetical protein